jgi:hypothetical protein
MVGHGGVVVAFILAPFGGSGATHAHFLRYCCFLYSYDTLLSVASMYQPALSNLRLAPSNLQTERHGSAIFMISNGVEGRGKSANA